MRAEIAGYFKGGHPFSDGYTSLNETQLYLLYAHVAEKKKEKKKDVFETIKAIIDVSFKKLDSLFDMVIAFINPKAFERLQQARKLDATKLEEDITEDNFLEEWEKIIGVIPEEITVEDSSHIEDKLLNEIPDPQLDKQIEQWATGFKKRQIRRGDSNGNE